MKNRPLNRQFEDGVQVGGIFAAHLRGDFP
jgi:hypothetical protein